METHSKSYSLPIYLGVSQPYRYPRSCLADACMRQWLLSLCRLNLGSLIACQAWPTSLSGAWLLFYLGTSHMRESTLELTL